MKTPIILHTSVSKRVETTALINCGAKGANYISRKFALENHIPLIPLKKPIPVLNVDGTENQGGAIRERTFLYTTIKGRMNRISFLATTLGRETVILGYPWLLQENPIIDWVKQTLKWTKPSGDDIGTIDEEPFESIRDVSLVISTIQGKLMDDAKEAWAKTQMSHSQLFGLQEEKKKQEIPKEEIVPKEFYEYLETVFLEREVG